MEKGGLDAVLSAMANLNTYSDVQEAACFALGALCVNNGNDVYLMHFIISSSRLGLKL